jgi:hypothetical protein
MLMYRKLNLFSATDIQTCPHLQTALPFGNGLTNYPFFATLEILIRWCRYEANHIAGIMQDNALHIKPLNRTVYYFNPTYVICNFLRGNILKKSIKFDTSFTVTNVFFPENYHIYLQMKSTIRIYSLVFGDYWCRHTAEHYIQNMR